MGIGRGMTLVELLVCVAILALLAAALFPSLSCLHARAQQVLCAGQMREVHRGLLSYAAAHKRRLPPFTYATWSGDVGMSGHFGGFSQAGDPFNIARTGGRWANLWVLVRDGIVAPRVLVCPGSVYDASDTSVSYFPYSSRYSTYCLRFPPSADAFRAAPGLAGRGRSPLDVYLYAAGGERVRVGAEYETVPQITLEDVYRLLPDAACGDGDFAPLRDAWLSDTWRRDSWEADPAGLPGLESYRRRISWCHGERFNVLYGCGAVREVIDGGVVREASLGDAERAPMDPLDNAATAERVWQFFDAQ